MSCCDCSQSFGTRVGEYRLELPRQETSLIFQMFLAVKTLQYLRKGIKFEDWCCTMHCLLKQVMECLISVQPPSCEGSSPASCIIHPTTLPPKRLQHTQTDNRRLILSPLWCHEYWLENREGYFCFDDYELFISDLQTFLWFYKPIMWKKGGGSCGVTAQTQIFHGCWSQTEVSLSPDSMQVFHSFILSVTLSPLLFFCCSITVSCLRHLLSPQSSQKPDADNSVKKSIKGTIKYKCKAIFL